jgi:hypothetical protein
MLAFRSLATGMTMVMSASLMVLHAQAQIPPAPAPTSMSERMLQSEARMWENMRRAHTDDELHAFVRTHPLSDKVPAVLTWNARSLKRTINTLNQQLQTSLDPALFKSLNIPLVEGFATELQATVATLQSQLNAVKAQHTTLTGKEIDMAEAETGTLRMRNGDIPSSVFRAVLAPLPYRAGYTWRMQMHNLLTQASNEYTIQVSQLLPFGHTELKVSPSASTLVLDEAGNIVTHASTELTRKFNVHYRQHPQSLIRGREHTFGFTVTDTLPDSKVLTEQGSQGSMTTIAPERLLVPAGPFDTWRVERRNNWKITETGANGTFAMTAWYSPVLRRYVKWEEKSVASDGKVLRHERHELTQSD